MTALAAGAAQAEDRGPTDVRSYSLHLVIDWAGRSVVGDETIHLRMRNPGRELGFSDNALEIVSATAARRRVEVRRDGGRMSFILPRPAHAGEDVTLRVAFRGRPKRGLIFEPGLAYTSYFTCDWMVCDQDRPGDKATFDLKLAPPPGGRLIPGVPSGSAYPAYLFGFLVGRFEETRLPRGLRAFGGAAPSGLEASTDMAAFFEAKAGAPLPRGYWQFVSAAPEAQEGAGFAILGRGVLPGVANPEDDWAIAHELAHQWWGNLVTCETWRDFWLNEGFATFMTAAWKEHRWGRAAYDREMMLARRRLEAARAAGYDKPLAWDGAYPSLGIRRAVQYSKGALFLDALRVRLGDAVFWRAVRLYTRRHAGGTVVSADFQATVEDVAPGRATDLFRAWVFDGV